jgi:hypothetical protein
MKNKLKKSIWPLLIAGVAAAGCASSPPPAAPPPDTVNDTSSETGMPEPVLNDVLDAAIDDTAQYLSANLPQQNFVKASQTKLVFALPPSLEHDATIPDGRLQSAIVALRTKLTENKSFTDNFMIINSTELDANSSLTQMQSDSSSSAFRDPLQRTADNTHAATYPPNAVYLLAGKFYQLTDQASGQREYKLFFTISNPQSRREVMRKEIDVHMVWDGQNKVWRKSV